jgi:hypothetical protein
MACCFLRKPYVSGPTRYWVKAKCPTWRRDNQQRFRMFEGNKKSAITEEQLTLEKKRGELTRVLERLRSPDLRPGIARELRSRAFWERLDEVIEANCKAEDAERRPPLHERIARPLRATILRLPRQPDL